MKKILTFTFLLFGFIQAWSHRFEWTDDKGVTWSVFTHEDWGVFIEGCSQTEGNLVIPCKVYDGDTEYEVTAIQGQAFFGLSNLASVNIPEGVTVIGDSAFEGCSGLTKITFPESITFIGEKSFRNCKSLTNISIPKGVIEINDGTFFNCTNLQEINLSENLKYLGSDAFALCGSLKNITLPSCLKEIGNGAFYGCSSLTNLNLPEGITIIPDFTFSGCYSLASIAFPYGLTRIGFESMKDCSSLTSIELPNGLKSIDDAAFYGCTSLRSLIIPSSIEYFGLGAFHGCKKLTKIYCYQQEADLFEKLRQYEGNGDTYDKYAFANYNATLYVPYGCAELFKVAYVWEKFKNILEIPSTGPLTTVGGISYNIANNMAYVTQGEEPYSGDIYIPEEIAYDNMSYLAANSSTETDASIVFYPVRNISDGAFRDCSDLTSVSFPENMESIGQSAFENCTGLTSVILPEGVTTISRAAFQGCTGLTSVTIPSTVKTIDYYAFNKCKQLTTVYSYMVVPPAINYYTFSHRKSATLFVPYGSKEAYSNANYWRQFNEILEIEPSSSGIYIVGAEQPNTEDGWFTLEGFKLNSQPAQKGIYIRNGKKVVVK